jgi:hypothetical protein
VGQPTAAGHDPGVRGRNLNSGNDVRVARDEVLVAAAEGPCAVVDHRGTLDVGLPGTPAERPAVDVGSVD